MDMALCKLVFECVYYPNLLLAPARPTKQAEPSRNRVEASGMEVITVTGFLIYLNWSSQEKR
jgi:hypothetical protein